MPRKQKLKVYRTPIGFHDAYVAAPSQKSALEAWGSDADLFSRGIAEVVTDEELAREPLAKPGVIIKRLRGSVDEQLGGAAARSTKVGEAPETRETRWLRQDGACRYGPALRAAEATASA